MKALFAFIFLASGLPAWGAVIYSSCPVPPTLSQSGEPSAPVDRHRPSDTTIELRRYSKDLSKGLYYLAWALSKNGQPPALDPEEHKAAVEQAGQRIEDLQFFMVLADTGNVCHSEKNPVSEAKAIFPFVARSLDSSGNYQYRIRYKLCAYYVDQKRQIPFEDGCEVLGRVEGYTFQQLEERYKTLNSNIEDMRTYLQAGVYGAGLLASYTSFRVLRVLKAGRLPSLIFSLIPAGAAHFAIHDGLTDELVRDAFEFKQTAEVAVAGDLSTSVAVARPIQEFAPYFVRYLESVK